MASSAEFQHRVVIGAECSIGPHSVIFYDVEIGENTLLGNGASIREKCRIGISLYYCFLCYSELQYSDRRSHEDHGFDLTSPATAVLATMCLSA